MFDHTILGTDDLDRGIAFVAERTGVRPMFGGLHPGRGTRNALLSLGPRQYLEILAPDPQQKGETWFPGLREMREPRLLGWAIHTDDITALAKKVSAAGFAIQGPTDGSRARPDGKILRWKSFRLANDRDGLLPFFIEWSRDSVHPSVDAPAGCRLERFFSISPNHDDLAAVYNRLGADISVERGEKEQLRARMSGPKATVEFTS
jgi:Glyoxalase-like domain